MEAMRQREREGQRREPKGSACSGYEEELGRRGRTPSQEAGLSDPCVVSLDGVKERNPLKFPPRHQMGCTWKLKSAGTMDACWHQAHLFVWFGSGLGYTFLPQLQGRCVPIDWFRFSHYKAIAMTSGRVLLRMSKQ